jgi:hypothetical protein
MDEPRQNQLEYETRRGLDARWGVFAFIGLMVAALIILFGWLQTAHHHQHGPPTSRDHLRRLGDEVLSYAADQPDMRYPDSFEALVEANGKYLSPELFASPTGPATPASDFETLFSEPGHISYVWIGRGLTVHTVTAETPLVYEGPVTDFEAGALFFFADYSIRRVKGEELRRLLSEAEERLRNATTLPATGPATSPTTTNGEERATTEG